MTAMYVTTQAAVLFLCVVMPISMAATEQFTVNWYDNRVHVLEYNRTHFSECLFMRNPDILKCTRTYSYKNVSDTWKYNSNIIKYVAVRCQQQEYYDLHKHVCICKTSKDAANPSNSIQHDKISYCQINSISYGLFKRLKNLEVLDLSDNLINNIDGGGLDGLASMKYLNLGHNPFEILPAGLLCQTSRLEVLIMENTRLKIFPDQIFNCSDHSNITYIDLSQGEISVLSHDSLEHLPKLVSLNLSSNAISQVNPKVFRNSTNLEYVDFSSNDFNSFPTEVCQPLSDNIRHVRLRENSIEFLNLDDLQLCESVQFLDVSYNRITNMFGSVSDSATIKHLNVSHNFIKRLTDNLLKNASMLETLDLSMNELALVSSNAFAGLGSLTSLDLSGNNMKNSSMLKSAMQPLGNLTSLNLSRNSLSEVIADMFQALSKLETLSISRNAITNINSRAFQGLVSLRTLVLCHNQLTALPRDVFSQLHNLQNLDLSSNSIVNFDDVIVPNSLKWTKLSDNNMAAFPNSFVNSSVTSLDTSHNVITSLDYKRMSASLTSLNVSHNKISSISPGTFRACTGLKTLDMASNNISANFSQDVFVGGNAMTHLNLSDNRVSNVDSMFSFPSLLNIEVLDISKNPIHSITSLGVKNMAQQRLSSVDVSSCSLTSIGVEAFRSFQNIQAVDLSQNNLTEFGSFVAPHRTKFNLLDNPLVCSCRMRWLKDSYSYKFGSCLVYPRMIQSSVTSLKDDDFLCQNEATCPAGCSCFSLELNGPLDTVFCSRGMTSPPTVAKEVKRLYLDGNKFKVLSKDVSNGVDMETTSLFLNLSAIEEIDSDFFSSFSSLEILDLSDNKITEIKPNTFQRQTRLQRLDLSHNFLTSLYKDSFNGLGGLKYLDLSHNEIQTMDSISVKEISRFTFSFRISVGYNAYRCACENAGFREWVEKHHRRIDDRSDIKCDDGTPLMLKSTAVFRCPVQTSDASHTNKKGIITMSVVLLAIVAVIGGASFYYRRDLLAVAFVKLRLGCFRHKYDQSKPQDAFVVYNTNDTKCSEWVNLRMLRKLQRNNRSYKLISPERARLLQSVADMETERLYECKCAVFVVSAGFSNHIWSNECFRKAWNYSKENKKFKIILIIYGDIDVGSLEPEMRLYLRKGNYITARSWSVWDRLLYELPDPQTMKLVVNDDDVSESDVILYNVASQNSLDDNGTLSGLF